MIWRRCVNLSCACGLSLLDHEQLTILFVPLRLVFVLSLAIMAVSTPLDPFLRGNTSKNTRGLLRIIILCTIAAAAVSARLFSVIRTHCPDTLIVMR